jgi:hypothetical protein
MVTIKDYFDFIFFSVLWVVIVVGLFNSVRQFTAGEKTRKITFTLLGFVSACILLGCVYLHLHYLEEKFFVSLQKSNKLLIELPENWGDNLNLEEKSKSSLSYASMAYTSTGKIIRYFDKAGNRTLFIPSQSQLTERDRVVETNQSLQDQSNTYYSIAIKWFLSGLAALVLGWMEGRRTSKRYVD